MTVKLRKFYENANQVNDDPLTCVFEDFLTDNEIDHILSAAKTELQQALVSDEKTGVKSPGRSGKNCWIAHDFDDVIAQLCSRIAGVVGIDLVNAESLQVIHYATTQEYAPHYDAWDADTERGQRCMARGGQRMVTCLLYLNEPEQGGGTCFPNLGMEVRARKGRMVLFHNCHPDTALRHEDSLHGGMPVLAGEKWACNLWFREKDYRITSKAAPASRGQNRSRGYSRVI